MPAGAYLKQEIEKTEQRRRRKKDRYVISSAGPHQEDAGNGTGVLRRQPEGNEGSGIHTELQAYAQRSVSNEAAQNLIQSGSIPEAANEHLRGLRGDNNGSFGRWQHEGASGAVSASGREELDKGTYTVSAGGDRAAFTPAHYAAYLQIWGTPQEAAEYYSRYLELREKAKTGELDREEKDELKKLQQLEQAALEFDDARGYQQEKNVYSQQDMDYAFAQNRHNEDGEKSEMFGTSHDAAGVYQALFLDAVFGGMKESYLKCEADGGISEEAVQALQAGRTPESLQGMAGWLDKYLADCAVGHRSSMAMIIRAIRRANPKHNRYSIMNYLENVLKEIYLRKEFVVTDTDARMMMADQHMGYALEAVLRNPGSRFAQIIRVLAERILAETV